MSIEYSAMLGVGWSYEYLKYDTLTDEAKGMFKDYVEQEVTDYDDYDGYDNDDDEIWEDKCLRVEFLHDCLDMVGIDSNAYSGNINTIGFDIELGLETLHQEVEKATNKFKRYFNIEPELLLGVSVW